MASTALQDRYVARSTWTSLSCQTLSLLSTVLVLAFAASLLTASMGIPDGVVPIAIATVGVVAIGLALVRLFTHLESNGIPCLE